MVISLSFSKFLIFHTKNDAHCSFNGIVDEMMKIYPGLLRGFLKILKLGVVVEFYRGFFCLY